MLEEGEPTFNERYNAALRGSKGWIYEGGIRVPMVLRWPDAIAAGRLRDDLAHFTDWMPTLLSLAGIERPPGPDMDGRNLAPLLLGEPLQVEPRQFWQWNFYWPDIGTNAAVRDGD